MLKRLLVVALLLCPVAAQAADLKTHSGPRAETGVAGSSTHYNQGNSLTSLGRYDEAITAYRKAIRIDPSSADAHNRLGAVYAQLGRWSEAVREGEETLRIDPNHRIAHLWLPMARERMREIK